MSIAVNEFHSIQPATTTALTSSSEGSVGGEGDDMTVSHNININTSHDTSPNNTTPNSIVSVRLDSFDAADLQLSDDDLDSLVETLRTPVGPKQKPPVIVKDRLYHLRRYKECFIARDFVQALLTLGYCQTKRHAVLVGKRLCRRGQMHHVVDDHDFRDGYYFFRWYADDLKDVQDNGF